MATRDSKRARRALHPGHIDIWSLRLHALSSADWETSHDMLDFAERERLRRFRVDLAKRHFLAGRLLLRRVLSFYLGRAAQEVRFEVDAFGRPAVVVDLLSRCLSFNLSHSGDMAVCAIAANSRLGIDVERLDRAVDVLETGRVAFAPPEFARLAAAPIERRHELFFRFWTLKEAYSKACGKGLRTPFGAFWFDLEGGEPKICFGPEIVGDPGEWAFRSIAVRREYRLALASAAPVHAMEFLELGRPDAQT